MNFTSGLRGCRGCNRVLERAILMVQLTNFLNSDGLLSGVCNLRWSFRRRISRRFTTIRGLTVYFATI